MRLPARFCPMLFATLALSALPVRAQVPGDRPAPAEPRRPETRAELNHREAVKLFGAASLAERQNRLLEAVKLYEQASALDPEAAAPLKAVVPLYLALDRLDDALASCKKATELDPADFATWYLYARQLRAHNRQAEAAAAFDRALACPRLKEQPEQHAQIAYELGALQESLQDFAAAEKAFREAVQVLDNPAALLEQGDFNRAEIDAQAAETYERLGRVCLRGGQTDRAVGYFVKARDKVREKDPLRARRLSYNLAEVHLAAERWEEALRALDDYLETRPQGMEAYRAKVKALTKLGRQAEVLPALQAYAARDRHNTALRLLVAEQYAAAGDFGRAENLYAELAQASPGPDIYRGLFQLYATSRPTRFDRLLQQLDDTLRAANGENNNPNQEQKGDADAAARARSMLAVLRESPELVRGLIPVAQQRMTARGSLGRTTSYYIGVLAARTRQLDAAEQLFRNALPERGGPARFNRGGVDADAYTNLLRVLRLGHKYEAIVELCRRGREEARNIYADYFHNQAAEALAHLGRFPEAVAEADKAVDVSPDDRKFEARLTRIHILTLARQYDRAAAECQELLKRHTERKEAHRIRHQLSNVYSSAHQYAQAEEQLRIILDEAPEDAWACNDLGYFWAEQGKNLEEAEKLIRKALELDRKQRASLPEEERESAAYIDSLGWVLFRRGQFEASRKELERASSLPTGAEDPVVWDHLGDVCYRLGDTARAAACWRKAIELWEVVRARVMDDSYKETKQKLKLLERQQ